MAATKGIGMFSRLVYLAFLLSGISGLVYQVVWVREFGRIFGNTVYSASLVTAVFMCGLGLGSYLVGLWVDRNYQRSAAFPLRMYGYFELAIASLAAILALALPALEPLSAHISSYEQGADGWYHLTAGSYAFRYGVAIVLLAPITFLMGGTLTLLIRFVLAENIELAGWRIGLLYGFNTGGAALGAFLSDFALIPVLGLLSAQLVAVCLNVLAAAVALRLDAGATASKAPPPPPEPAAGEDASPAIIALTGAAILLSGFAAMGIEILWFRHLNIGLGSLRAVFSLLLTVILLGMWAGSVVGGLVHRRFKRPVLFYMLSQTAFVLVSLFLLARIDTSAVDLEFRQQLLRATGLREWLLCAAFNLRPIVLITGVPAFLMGFAYPLANANIQRAVSRVGRRAGLLYLANTLGAVLGSTITGFWLIPTFGIQRCALILAIVAASTLVPLVLSAPTGHGQTRRRRVVQLTAIPCALALVLALWAWSALPPQLLLAAAIPKQGKLLHLSEGVYEVIAVTEGKDPSDRLLFTNGHNMASTQLMSQRYMRHASHLPLLLMDQPTDMLLICFGTGSTLHAASLHPSIQRIEAVDLSRHVLEQGHFFEPSNHGVLEDPRVHVFVNDGRQHLWMQDEERYDLITLEPPPISFAGVSALYSKDFYELVRSRLKPDGTFTQWLPAYQVPEDTVRSMVRAFLDVFPDAVLLSGERKELVLMGTNGPARTVDPDLIQRKLRGNPAIQADLERVYLGTTTEIIGSFLASPAILEAGTKDVAPVTDNRPLMEYSVRAKAFENQFPRDLIDVRTVGSWCPGCFVGDGLAPSVPYLVDYLVFLDAYYSSDAFLNHRTYRVAGPQLIDMPPAELSPAYGHCSYLPAIFSLKEEP